MKWPDKKTNAPLAVLFVTTSYPRKADEPDGWFVETLASELAHRKNQVTVLAPGDGKADTCEDRNGVRIHRPTYFLPRRCQRLAYGPGIPWNFRNSWIAKLNVPFFVLRFLCAIVVLGRRHQLIHAHWGVTGALALMTRWLHRCPVVLTVHGSDLRTHSRFTKRLTRYAIRRASAVTTLSKEFFEKLKNIRDDQTTCHVIPNGTHWPDDQTLSQTRRFDPSRMDYPSILSVGSLIPERHHAQLLQAVASLRQRHPNIHLTLVGDGPEKNSLKALAKQLNFEEAVQFTGQVPPREVQKHLLMADLYVSPTTIDNFGTAVVEAAAHGLPVVTTAVGFPGELIRTGHSGAVVEPNRPDLLLDAMKKLLEHPETLRTQGRAARDQLATFGIHWETACDRTLAVYQKARIPS